MSAPDTQGMLVRIPRAWVRALKRYGVDHDTSLQAIGVEALRDWAERHGVKLDDDSAPAEDSEPDAA